MPCPGRVDLFLPPGGKGVRTDSFIYPGFKLPPNYDSLLGKLIIWGKDREETLQRADRALEEFVIDGVKTTIPFQKVVKHSLFIEGNFDTGFVENHLEVVLNVGTRHQGQNLQCRLYINCYTI